MADLNMLQAPGGESIAESGGYVHIVIGGVDYFISRANLLKANTDDIAILENTTTNNETRITTIESSILKNPVLNTTTFQFDMAAGSLLEMICINRSEQSPLVKVGTTSGGDELIAETELTTDDDGFTTTFNKQFNTATTIYVTVTGGRIDLTRFTKTGLFS